MAAVTSGEEWLEAIRSQLAGAEERAEEARLARVQKARQDAEQRNAQLRALAAGKSPTEAFDRLIRETK